MYSGAVIELYLTSYDAAVIICLCQVNTCAIRNFVLYLHMCS